MLWCDGRRRVDLPPGARIEVRRGATPVLLARLRGDGDDAAAGGAPFTDRLVAKFGLPVAGWRGRPPGRARPAAGTPNRSRAPMLEEVRITALGVIDDAVLELSPGFTVVTGETGAGKTMVVTGLGLMFGGRADPARVRPGADRATVEGRLRIDPRGRVAEQVAEAGGELDDDGATLIVSRSVSAEGRSRAYAGGHSVPVSLLTYLADDLVAVHGQADQQQLLRAGRQRESLDRFAGPAAGRGRRPTTSAPTSGTGRSRGELAELTGRARERAQEAEDLRRGLAEIERLEPVEGEDVELRAEEERLANADALHTAASAAHDALLGDPASGSYDLPDAVSLLAAASQALDGGGRSRPGAGRAGRPADRGQLPGLRRRAPSWPPTSSRSRPTRPGWPRCRSGAPS